MAGADAVPAAGQECQLLRKETKTDIRERLPGESSGRIRGDPSPLIINALIQFWVNVPVPYR